MTRGRSDGAEMLKLGPMHTDVEAALMQEVDASAAILEFAESKAADLGAPLSSAPALT